LWDHADLCPSPPRGRNNADEQYNPDIRMDDSTVMLSAAKHLAAQRDRPSLRSELALSAANGVTVEGPISSSVVFFESP
jgi:hypothetical protein